MTLRSRFAAAAIAAAAMVGSSSADVSFRYYDSTHTSYITLTSTATVTLTWPGTSSGGHFEVNTVTGSLPYYGSGSHLFDTFCLENQQHFTPGHAYVATVDDRAYSGGVGLAGDPLSAYSEYIYGRWNNGNPDGWSDTDVSRALWFCENEAGGVANAVYASAQTALGVAAATQNASSNTRALNLWTLTWVDGGNGEGWYEGGDNQSQIMMVPVPGASLLCVLGLGVLGLMRRR